MEEITFTLHVTIVISLLCILTLLPLYISIPLKNNDYSAANWFVCGFETFLLGGCCATVAYTIGQFVDGLVSEA